MPFLASWFSQHLPLLPKSQWKKLQASSYCPPSKPQLQEAPPGIPEKTGGMDNTDWLLLQDQTENHGMTGSENALHFHNKFRAETTRMLISLMSECCVQKKLQSNLLCSYRTQFAALTRQYPSLSLPVLWLSRALYLHLIPYTFWGNSWCERQHAN